MALRPLVSSSEPRVQRDDDFAIIKPMSLRTLTTNQLDGSTIALSETMPDTVAQRRRRVVIPDPIAFRYVASFVA